MTKHWQDCVQTIYGIKTVLTRLHGEFDLNFKAKASSGQTYVLKVMRLGCEPALVDVQCKAMQWVKSRDVGLPVPAVIKTLKGDNYCSAPDPEGKNVLIWLIEGMDGVPLAQFKRRDKTVVYTLGQKFGHLRKALEGFSHSIFPRKFIWHLPDSRWVKEDLNVIADIARRKLISDVVSKFEDLLPHLNNLPCVAIQNDLNDHNLLMDFDPNLQPGLSGLLDFGDITYAPGICELAVAGAYLVFDQPDPQQVLADLVAGFCSTCPLSASEIDLLYPLLRMRLAASVVNSSKVVQTSDDPYVLISQKSAWDFLESADINAEMLTMRLRAAAGHPICDHAPRVCHWLDQQRGQFAPIVDADLAKAPVGPLSVVGSTEPENPFDMTTCQAPKLGAKYGCENEIWLGAWLEPRLTYTAAEFYKGPWKASDRRTVHLAVDVFANAGTVLRAPLDGVVEVAENRAFHLDYGGVIILRHETPEGDSFYTLYGHLDPDDCALLKPGDDIKKGEVFCRLGDPEKNGGWSPHLHFQLALSINGIGQNWPGVADPNELYFWQQLCPNPAALLNLPDEKTAYQPVDQDSVLAGRQRHFSRNLTLSYDKPVMFLRGWKTHLFDEMGRPYLDAYNNVPHVGHAHPRLQAVVSDQMARLNSNTRYLHPAQVAFAKKLVSKMPDGLEVCFFTASGSEANELALRLAWAATGARDMITPDHGYHGNTTGAMALSAYKFKQAGGDGKEDWVHLVDVADDYKGAFQRNDPQRGAKFALQVARRCEEISQNDKKLAGFIAETFPSVGGQIIPPPGYLKDVYAHVRAAGGLCIADEVQTGLGRLGDFYFGFEHQGAVPDVVVLGKPIGNGHPIGVVVTTREIADVFAKTVEYFSTFGGSTLSCKIGCEVLNIIDDEGLAANAKSRGDQLLAGLTALQDKHQLIGDVRGLGLFIGVEMVADRATKTPTQQVAKYIANRLRDKRILIGTDGQSGNILKIRPPLTIEKDDIEMLLHELGEVLEETDQFNFKQLRAL